jgi:glycosyltransferase involved in cell wall biosynthesis
MNIACIIHRFGADIAGGSEGHCRVIAERLAANHDVTILTTCAKDHVTWHNEYPAGVSTDGRLRVHRFRVERPRSLHRFRDVSDLVFSGDASRADEEQWFRENGPETPELLTYLERHGHEFDRLLFWSFRYYQTFFGLPIVADRAVLVPTAEEDPVIRLRVLDRFFAKPAGYLFLTPEEETLVASHCSTALAPSATVGVGLDPAHATFPTALEPAGITRPYVLYLGRVDPNKGCETLIKFFLRTLSHPAQAPTLTAEDAEGAEAKNPGESPSASFASSAVTFGVTKHRASVPLVLAGPQNMPIPEHPLVKRLGFVDEGLRESLLSNAALLVVPSPYESLSMVLLEAWNHGIPALVNGRCAVLKGQARRSDGALYYQNYDEFARALDLLLGRPEIAKQIGQQGLAYVEREYRWPRVIHRIEQLLAAMGSKAATA